MAIKDILVHVGGSSRTGPVALAANLAVQYGAHLAGLHVSVLPDIPPYIEAQLGSDVLDAQARFAKEEVAKAQTLFETATNVNGLSTQWSVIQGDPVECIQRYGRYTDLVVVGQTNPDEPGFASGQDVAGRLVLSLGRPVLTVPSAGHFETVGKRVMIAWDGGRAAARALGDAMTLLQDAEDVTILSVNRDVSGHDTGLDIAQHLARHGIKAQTQNLEKKGMDTGAMMLSCAKDFGADLVVMGAYGHARWRELVLGGVTQHMLAHMNVPVLMAH